MEIQIISYGGVNGAEWHGFKDKFLCSVIDFTSLVLLGTCTTYLSVFQFSHLSNWINALKHLKNYPAYNADKINLIFIDHKELSHWLVNLVNI